MRFCCEWIKCKIGANLGGCFEGAGCAFTELSYPKQTQSCFLFPFFFFFFFKKREVWDCFLKRPKFWAKNLMQIYNNSDHTAIKNNQKRFTSYRIFSYSTAFFLQNVELRTIRELWCSRWQNLKNSRSFLESFCVLNDEKIAPKNENPQWITCFFSYLLPHRFIPVPPIKLILYLKYKSWLKGCKGSLMSCTIPRGTITTKFLLGNHRDLKEFWAQLCH